MWTGRILAALVVAALAADAAVLLFAVDVLREDMKLTGFDPAMAPELAAIITACAALFAIPATSALGAVLVTGFLGGAICMHFRIGELASPSQLACLALGVMAWLSVYLRFPATRALLPLAR
ncbi:DoxX family protein [Camelimonas abortus]|uniref:DoxX family protein n=1 Tax=Camelimonas abortus TaxID=1017184 RepID=A0ABV7LDJ5_9HYPH